MLDSELFNSVIVTVIKLAKDTFDLFLCQALYFPYGSNHDSKFDVHAYHGNPLSHNNPNFCLKLVYL